MKKKMSVVLSISEYECLFIQEKYLIPLLKKKEVTNNIN
jgi:hypothetical protein